MIDMEEATLRLREWQTPATSYEEKQVGDFRLKLSRYCRGNVYPYWGMDDYLFFKCIKEIPVMLLQEKANGKWKQWMVDDPPQYRAMQIYAKAAKGRVLCAGLGLGLIQHELVKNKKVTQVVTIERSQEVADLVWDYCPNKAKSYLVIQDFWEFFQKNDEQWDMILADLWVSRGAEDKLRLLHEIIPLVVELRTKWPNAKVVIHGFQTLSDVKPVRKKMVKLIVGCQVY